jgi:hypothetical protein
VDGRQQLVDSIVLGSGTARAALLGRVTCSE